MAEIKFKVTLETIIKSNTDWYDTNSKMKMAEIEEKDFKNNPGRYFEIINSNKDAFSIIVEPIE